MIYSINVTTDQAKLLEKFAQRALQGTIRRNSKTELCNSRQIDLKKLIYKLNQIISPEKNKWVDHSDFVAVADIV